MLPSITPYFKDSSPRWRTVFLCLLGWCLLGGVARTQTTLYIDNNGNATGFGWVSGNTTTWDANTTAVWTSSAAGTNNTVTWNAIGGNSSTIVGLNGTVSTSTVSVNGSFTIAGLTKNGNTTQISITGNNSLTFAPNATVTHNANQYLTFNNLSPLGDFTSNGTGIIRFTNSYTGNVTVTNGDVQWNGAVTSTGANIKLNGGNLTGNANLGVIIGNLSGNSTSSIVNTQGPLTVTQAGDETFLGTITGSRIQGPASVGTESNFTKNGSATLALGGNNTYAGATVVNAGTLSIATIANAGIRLTGNYVASNATVTANSTAGLAGGMTVVSTSATTRQRINSISGATFTMNANASSAGTNVVSLVGFANGLGLSDSTATNLQIGNATLRYTGVTASTDRNFTLINGTTAGIDVSQAGTTLTMSGSAASTTAAFNKLGNGTLVFTGNHSYTGATTISAGTLSVSTLANGLSVSSIGQSTNVASNLILNGGTLQYTGVGVSTDRLFSLQSSSTIDASGTGALNLSNIGTMGFNGGTAVKTLTLTGNNTGSNTLAAVIGNNGNATSVIKAGTGTWVLTGANSYSGGTTISNGTLRLSGAAGSAGSASVSISSGALLQLDNSASSTISNNISGAGNIAHTSLTGVTTTLSGNNTNTGAVSSTGGGTLLFSGANALSSGITSLNATSASTLSFVDGTTRTITLGSSGISLSSAALSFDVNLSNSTSDRLSFSGPANLTGTNTVNLSFLNSLSGTQTWTLLTAASGLDSGAWSLGTYTNQSGYTFSLNSTATTLSLIASAGSSEAYWTGAGGTSWTATNFSSTINGGASIPGGNLTSSSIVIFAGTGAGNLTTTLGANYTIKSLTVSTPEVAINGSNTINVTSSSVSGIDISAAGNTTIGANLAGNAGLSKSGTGTLTLNGSNTYSGGTTITGGTVVIGSSTAFGNAAGAVTLNPGTGNTTTVKIGASNLNVSNNIVLNSGTTAIDTNSFNATASGILSSSGALTKLGAGTLALSGNNSHVGSITISAGTLEIASTGLLGGGTYFGAITNNGTLTYSGASNQSLGGVISGTGSVIQNATSTLTLTGNNTYTGATTINAGVLNIQDANALGTTANGTTVVSGAALQLQGNILVGAEALTLSGNGVSNDGALRNISGSNTYAGAITLNAATRINSDSGVLTLTGNIGGAGQNLTLGGAGTTILTGSNTYSGATTITAGTLQVGNAGTTGNLSTSSSITNNGTLTFNRSNNITQGTDFGTVISGTGSLIQAGSGNLVLSGANNYTGNTTLNSGTLCINNSGSGGTNSAIGTGTLIINSGTISNTSGSLVTLSTNNTQIWNAGFTFNGPNDLNLGTGNVTLSTGLSVTTAGGNLTVGGVISGSSTNLNKYGSGILNLSGNSSYTGITNIYVGTLSVSILANGGASSSIGQSSNAADRLVIAGAGTTLRYTGAAASTDRLFTLSYSGTIDASGTGALNFTNTGSITLGTGAKTLTVTGNNTGLNTLALAIGDNTGATSIAKNGTGTWVLSGNNSYSGATTVSAGTLSVSVLANGGSNSNIGASTNVAGNLILNSGTLQYTGAAVSTDRLFSLQSNSTIDASGSGALNFTNTGSMGFNSGTAAKTLTLTGNNTGSNTIAAVIGDNTGATSLSKNGTGTWVLSGNNSYSGVTTINSGTLSLGGSGTSTIAGNITIAGGELNYSNSSNNQIADTANITISAGNLTMGARTETINSLSLSGGNLTIGSGTLSLSAASNFTGGTVSMTSASGRINTTGTTTLGTTTFSYNNASDATQGIILSGDFLVNSSATANFTNTSTGSGRINLNGANRVFDVGSGANMNVGWFIEPGTGTRGITKNGTGTLTLSGNNTYTGVTTINAGVLNLQHANALGGTGSGTTVSSGAALQLQGGISIGAETLSLTGSGNGSDGAGAIRNISGNNAYGGVISLAGATTIGSDAGTLTLSSGSSITGTNTNLTIVGAGNITINDAIATGSGTLTKNGSGTLTLSGNNTYTGVTTINAGVLNLQYANALGGTGSGTTVSSGAALQLQGGISIGAETLSLTGSGNGSDGAGALRNISGNNAYGGVISLAGATTIGSDAGTLTLSSGNSITGTNTNLTIVGAGNITINDAIATGSGTLTKNGSGTLTLSGNNTYTGVTTINAGNLSFSTPASLASTSGVSLANATALIYTGGAGSLGTNITVTGATGSTGTIRNNGSGLLTLSGGLSKNGTTLTLAGGSNGITVSGAIGGSNANSDLIIDGGSVTLASANSYNGPTSIINGAILTASAINALPTANGRTAISMDATGSGTSRLSLGASQSIASLSGAASSNVTLGSSTLTVGTSGGSTTFAGRITGSGSLVKDGASTQVLTGDNTGFTGTTTVKSGTLQAAAAGAMGNSTVINVTGGSFLVTAANAVSDSTNINLDGGRMAVNGNFNESVGLLTLSADSIIDLNGFVGTLRFSGVGAWANTANLAIWNWNGINQYGTPVGDGANNRHVVFTSNIGLASYLDRISFYSDNGTSFAGSGFEQGFSGSGTEIIAVPEPETYATAGILLLAGALVQWMRRKQRT